MNTDLIKIYNDFYSKTVKNLLSSPFKIKIYLKIRLIYNY